MKKKLLLILITLFSLTLIMQGAEYTIEEVLTKIYEWRDAKEKWDGGFIFWFLCKHMQIVERLRQNKRLWDLIKIIKKEKWKMKNKYLIVLMIISFLTISEYGVSSEEEKLIK